MHILQISCADYIYLLVPFKAFRTFFLVNTVNKKPIRHEDAIIVKMGENLAMFY